MRIMLFVLLFVAIATQAFGYTYDSDTDPKKIAFNCQTIIQQPHERGEEYQSINRCNNEYGEYVVWVLHKNGTANIIQYAVKKDGVIYIYCLNENGRYEQIQPDFTRDI